MIGRRSRGALGRYRPIGPSLWHVSFRTLVVSHAKWIRSHVLPIR